MTAPEGAAGPQVSATHAVALQLTDKEIIPTSFTPENLNGTHLLHLLKKDWMPPSTVL